jgi:hypothetical protein
MKYIIPFFCCLFLLAVVGYVVGYNEAHSHESDALLDERVREITYKSPFYFPQASVRMSSPPRQWSSGWSTGQHNTKSWSNTAVKSCSCKFKFARKCWRVCQKRQGSPPPFLVRR